MKTLRGSLIFLFLIIISDYLLGTLLSKYYYSMKSGPNAKITYMVDELESDVLIFGSSSATHNYNIELLEKKIGLSCFNGGRDGTGLLYYNGLQKMILKRYSPKIIILDLHPASLNAEYTDYLRIAPLIPYYHDHPEIREIINRRSKFERIKLVSRIYPYNSQIWDIFRMQTNGKSTDFLQLKGFLPLEGNIKPDVEIPKVGNMNLDQEKINFLVDFINHAKNKNIRVIIVIPPEYIPKFTYPISYIKSICSQNGAEIFDFSNDPELHEPKLYYDFTHLNVKGAELISDKLSDSILNYSHSFLID